jgi:hypothetical protein
MQTMSSRPILFYSTRCSHSKQILDTLTALNKQNLFTLVVIDGKSRAELPPFLKSVPTLYHPETKDIFVGQDIFGYISKPVAARREVPNNTPAAGSAGGQSATAAKGDLEAWSFGTANGFSDSYSSWDGKQNVTDQLFYTFLGPDTSAAGPAEPQTKQSYDGAKDGRNEDVASRLKKIQQARDNEFKGVTRQ